MSTNLGFNKNGGSASAPKRGKDILVGRVTKVILGQFTKKGTIDPDFANQGGWGSVGKVKFNLFQDSSNPAGEIKSNNFAKPLFSNIKQYPLEGELVAIIAGPSTTMNDKASAQEFYYISMYNLWNNSHHNAFPDPVSYANYAVRNTTDEEKGAGAKQSQGEADIKYPLGDYFKEKDNIKSILPFEGDFILEGRWGQSVRFGSTSVEQKNNNTWSGKTKLGKDGDPITIISNRRAPDPNSPESWIPGIENINKDGSSIWMSSTQAINVDVSKYPLDTFRLGYKAEYNQDTVLPLQDISPAIQTIASQEYDKRVLDNVGGSQYSKTTMGSNSSTVAPSGPPPTNFNPEGDYQYADTGGGNQAEPQPSNGSNSGNTGGGGSGAGGGGGRSEGSNQQQELQ